MNKKFLLTGLAALFAVQTFAQEPAVEMVTVQGGQFYMGNNYMENAALSDEAPEHKVTVKSFKMSKTEVPFDLFDLFCDATGWKKPKDASSRWLTAFDRMSLLADTLKKSLVQKGF